MSLVSGTATPLGTAAIGSIITYVPGIALNIGDKITFTLTNAVFKDANYYLLVDETQAAVGDIDAAVAGELQEVGNWISGGLGTASVTMRIANYNVGATYVLYLVSSNADADTGADVAAPTAAYANNLAIRVAGGLGNTAVVTLMAENSEDVGGTPLSGADATAVTVITVETQFSMTFTAGTSQINVTSPSLRKNFTAEAAILGGVGDSELTASGGSVSILNDLNSSINDFVNMATYPAAVSMTLGAVGNDFGALDFAGTRVFFDDNGNNATDGTAPYSAFDSVTHIATFAASNLVAQGATWSDDVYVGVDGTNLLTTQTWPVTAELNFTNALVTDLSGTSTTFLIWTINGYQAIIPYATTNPAYATYCISNNTAVADADVVIDVISSNTASVMNSIGMGSIAGQSTGLLVFSSQAISNGATSYDASALLGTDERYSARVTITADQNAVFLNCIQADPGGPKRVVPVLTDRSNILYGN
jgi:hypothetical protein